MKELIYPRILLPRAERFADKVGFVDVTRAGVRYTGTFATHVDRVLRLSHALQNQLGISRDDRYAVLAMNGHEFIELYHAALFGAGIINPLNIRFSAAELAYVLNDSGTTVVFTDPVFATLIERARTGGGRQDRHPRRDRRGRGRHQRAGRHHHRSTRICSLPGSPSCPPSREEDDPVILMYTGGTTGLPKGALLDQRAEVLNVYHVALQIGLPESRRFLFQSPMFHAAVVAGVLGIPASGATSVSIPLFDPELVLDTIETQQIDTTMMVPVMMSMLEQHESFAPSPSAFFAPARLRRLSHLADGAPAVAGHAPRRRLLPGIRHDRGSVGADLPRARGAPGSAGTCWAPPGAPVFGVELRITDSLGNDVAPGQAGEVCARGGNLMRGYWGKPEETEEAMRDGWYRTGDVGYLDERGLLHLTDRMKDMIVTGGENVYSTEVEDAIATHPAVREVAVIGVPSDSWGEAVHAIVVLKEDMKVTGEQLIEHARQRLSSFKVPKSVEFHDGPLPLSGAFKPLKRELRRHYRESHQRQTG